MSGADAPGFDPEDIRDIDRREFEREAARDARMLELLRQSQLREEARRDMMREAMELQDRERQLQEDAMERFRRADAESVRRLMEVINDPSITIDQETVDAINDPEVVMTPTGDVARVTRRGLGTGQFAGQFASLRGFDLPKETKRKRTRKKNPNLSKAFKEANKRLRRNNGQLRKGKSQADVAKLAHRILKGMR